MLGEFRGRKGVAQVKYAYRNGYLLDGTENMQVRSGLAVLTEGKLITGIVPERELPEGSQKSTYFCKKDKKVSDTGREGGGEDRVSR